MDGAGQHLVKTASESQALVPGAPRTTDTFWLHADLSADQGEGFMHLVQDVAASLRAHVRGLSSKSLDVAGTCPACPLLTVTGGFTALAAFSAFFIGMWN